MADLLLNIVGIISILLIVDISSIAAVEEDACIFDEPLGMISKKIQDWQISSSSTFPSHWAKHCEEHNARLYLRNGVSWCAKYRSPSEWLQVDLGVAGTISGVLTQGRGDGKEWVKEFLISYSLDAQEWKYVNDLYGNQKIFEGNDDAYTVKHNYLDKPIFARFVKFHTQKWHNHPSMRVEIHGCQACKRLMGIPPYAKLASSSARGKKSKRACTPEYGHILSNKAWCAKRQDRRQWLQFDLGPPTRITGLVIKGRGDGRKRHWVTRFKVSYSNDSRVWFFYKDKAFLDPKSFAGNSDKNTERIHYLSSPFSARYVRFHPLTWHGRISMRAGLFGCPHTGDCGPGFFKINKNSKCVANLAYKKEAWVNLENGGGRHDKRHLSPDENHWHHGQAKKAVDGLLDDNLRSCTVLNNKNGVDIPVWFVDLRERNIVSGVRIHTWQGRGQDRSLLSYLDYFTNLDQLQVYITNRPRRVLNRASKYYCGKTTRLNDAVFNKIIHISCARPLKGRYVYIEAYGVNTGWSKQFSAVLCEVEIY